MTWRLGVEAAASTTDGSALASYAYTWHLKQNIPVNLVGSKFLPAVAARAAPPSPEAQHRLLEGDVVFHPQRVDEAVHLRVVVVVLRHLLHCARRREVVHAHKLSAVIGPTLGLATCQIFKEERDGVTQVTQRELRPIIMFQ